MNKKPHIRGWGESRLDYEVDRKLDEVINSRELSFNLFTRKET